MNCNEEDHENYVKFFESAAYNCIAVRFHPFVRMKISITRCVCETLCSPPPPQQQQGLKSYFQYKEHSQSHKVIYLHVISNKQDKITLLQSLDTGTKDFCSPYFQESYGTLKLTVQLFVRFSNEFSYISHISWSVHCNMFKLVMNDPFKKFSPGAPGNSVNCFFYAHHHRATDWLPEKNTLHPNPNLLSEA